jgi:prepilin-type N-terminal cleavage/methylation domain-containing protein
MLDSVHHAPADIHACKRSGLPIRLGMSIRMGLPIRVEHSTRQTPSGRGFTIVELLLTLAILVTLAAMIVPAFGNLLADRQIARAGDQLRVEMMHARLSAMRSGRTYLLQMRLGSNEIRIRPWVDMNDMTESLDQTGGSSALLMGGTVMGGAMQNVDVEQDTRQVELPEVVTVSDVRVASSPRSYMIEMQTQGESGDGWSQPILFYPDGSTSMAAATIDSEGVGRVIVTLRSLTGEVSVTDVLAPGIGGVGN